MPETAFLGAQITPNRCPLGLRPRPHWESLQRSPRPPSWIQGILLLREGEGREERGGEGREGRGSEGRGALRKNCAPRKIP